MTDKLEAPMHWVVLADSARAQIFAADLMIGDLIPIEGRVHPASRLPARDIVAGDRGATRDGVTGVQSRFERHTDPHRAAVDTFARELAELLREGRIARHFQRLILIAPPTFLGALRAQLDTETARQVVLSIANEWTTLPKHVLAPRIRQSLGQMTAPV